MPTAAPAFRLSAFLVAAFAACTFGSARAQETGAGLDPAMSKRIAFELGAKLSLAALGYHRGAPQEAIDSLLEKIKVMADATGVEVPAFPAKTGDDPADAAAIVHYLLKDGGGTIGAKLNEKFGADHSALFELALKSNLLMLLYTPEGTEGATIAEVIGRMGPKAGVPEELYKPLTDKIAAKASFDEVKEAVSVMHEAVRQHLTSASN